MIHALLKMGRILILLLLGGMLALPGPASAGSCWRPAEIAALEETSHMLWLAHGAAACRSVLSREEARLLARDVARARERHAGWLRFAAEHLALRGPSGTNEAARILQERSSELAARLAGVGSASCQRIAAEALLAATGTWPDFTARAARAGWAPADLPRCE